MKTLLVVFHTHGVNTAQMVEALEPDVIAQCEELGATFTAGLAIGVL